MRNICRKSMLVLAWPFILLIDILIGLSGYRSFTSERLYSIGAFSRMWRNDHSDDTESIKDFLKKRGALKED